VTTLCAVAFPPFDKPVCKHGNVELRKALTLLGVDRLDRMKFWLTGLTGETFLTTRKHELIQAGISLGGAARMAGLVEEVMTKVVIVEGETFTLPNPQEFKSMLTAHGASGLKKKGDPSAMVYNGLGMLTPGSDYTYAYGKGYVWAKLEGARATHQGTLNRITDLHEKDAAAALETQLEEKYGESVVFKLPNARLMAPARMPASGVQTNRKPQGSVPDGAFLVTLADAQMVYVLEAKFDGDGDVTNAKRQLDGYAMAATRKFPNAEIVKVYSHLGITPETKAELKKLVIKSFDRIGNTYSALE